ncbi:MAG TPA: NAD-binding protein [Anaerolineaceae bacterium]|nr:NAD-binding protein [Anaerolineaceae bacterium]
MPPIRPSKSSLREWQASWRDSLVLLREFQKPLLLFFFVIIGSGFLYYELSKLASQPVGSVLEAIFTVLTLTFLEWGVEFPKVWYLQMFNFMMPFLGIIILAQGLADFGVLFFNRRARGKEWQMAVASTFKNHVVIIGLGHLGYRVVESLAEMNQDVVVVEAKPRPNLVSRVHDLNIPVIEGDGTQESVLISAGVERARSIILCTQNDSLNLQMALMSRKLNPGVEVIIRIFDDNFAEALHEQFGFRALSATGMAAPVFASTAAGIDITPPVNLDGHPNCMAKIDVSPTSPLVGQCIEAVETRFEISIVMLRHNGQTDLHPQGQLPIRDGDQVILFGSPQQIQNVIHARNKR